MAVLELKNVSLVFGGLTAVDNLSISVPKGQIFSIIGPNGAGKTSVFNLITGLYSPTRGTILLNDQKLSRTFSKMTLIKVMLISVLTGLALTLSLSVQSLWETVISTNYQYQQPFPWTKAVNDFFLFYFSLPPNYSLLPLFIGTFLGVLGSLSIWFRSSTAPEFIAQQGIARTFQNIRLFSEMSVYENVLIGAEAANKYHNQPFVMDLLDFVGLKNNSQLKAGNLSYGEQRRLEIARALATKPQLLLLDEPAAGMNPTETLALMDLIRKIKNQGITIILIDHHMRVVMSVSNHIAVLNYGNKIAEGTPEEIQANPEVIKAYLGGDLTK